MDNSNTFKVRLDSYRHGSSSTPTSTVVFDVMPVLTESVQVEYQSYDPLHMPGTFHAYKGTKARTFELGELKLISRTSEEASKNQDYMNILRSWARPYFGMSAGGSNKPPQSVTPVIGGNKYMFQDASGAIDKAKLRPLSLDEMKGVLNSREAKAANRFPLKKTNPKETAYLKGQEAAGKVTAILDSATAEEKRLFQMRDASEGSVAAHSLIKIPSGGAAVTGGVGQKSAGLNTDLNLLGAPPDVLYLTAYSDARNSGGTLDKPTNIYRVPVVLTALTITYPNDVDYIPTMEGQPFPIIMNISVSMMESHSPKEMEKFDLTKYRAGLLPGF